MAVVYFDSSAFVKLLVDESGSHLAAELWDGCDAAVTSRLTYPEVRAALASANRDHILSDQGLRSAESDCNRFWAAVRPVELTATVQQNAGNLAVRYALRGADAVHLASAMALKDHELIFAVWDRRLHAGANDAGLRVAPANLRTSHGASSPR